jgi:uncharacterized membrane protein
MKDACQWVKIAVMAILTVGTSTVSSDETDAGKAGGEKCYGIVKKGMNSCSDEGHNHSCSGESPRDRDPNEWIYVPTGTCHKIKGGRVG